MATSSTSQKKFIALVTETALTTGEFKDFHMYHIVNKEDKLAPMMCVGYRHKNYVNSTDDLLKELESTICARLNKDGIKTFKEVNDGFIG